MAIPFLQPEEDEAARQHHATGGGGGGGAGPPQPGSGSSGSAAGGPSASGIVVGIVGPMVPGSPGIPIPGSPAPPAPSGTSTAVQTPLIGPMNGDQLVQLFYEALYRYSRGDTPSTPISQSPQSSSCSPFTTGYYTSGAMGGAGGGGTGQVFFPQTPNGVLVPPRTPSTPAMAGRAMFFGQPPTPSPSGSSSHSSQHSANSPGMLDSAGGTQASSTSCSTAAPIFHQFPSSFSGIPGSSSNTRSMFAAGNNTSANSSSAIWPDEGDDSSESDSSSSQPSSSMSSSGEGGGATGGGNSSSSNLGAIGCSPHCLGLHHHQNHHPQLVDVVGGSSSGSSSTAMGFIPPHLDFMAGREQLQEFTGKIPQRKKKPKPGKSKKSKFLEQTLVWPTLAVTATLIALGCGLLAAR